MWSAAALVVGGGLWLLAPVSMGNVARSEPARLQQAAVAVEPTATDSTAHPIAAAPGSTAALTADEAELDRMRISSQSWRRGGLGSKALVTFTLRNENDYAVKDVEIFCAFNRRDGSHLTDRRRVFPDTVNMKSRKTFARVPVGFININASQVKCSLVAARRV